TAVAPHKTLRFMIVPPFRCLRLGDRGRASCACTLSGARYPLGGTIGVPKSRPAHRHGRSCAKRLTHRTKAAFFKEPVQVAPHRPARRILFGSRAKQRNVARVCTAHGACVRSWPFQRGGWPQTPALDRPSRMLSRDSQWEGTDSGPVGARRAVAVHRLLEHLAGLEGEHAAPGDDDLLAGLRVPPLARALLV